MTIYTLPLDQIQGDITPGFRKDFQVFIFLRFPRLANSSKPDLKRVRAWLRALRPSIASAEEVATFNHLYRIVKQRAVQKGDKSATDGEKVAKYLRSTWVNVAFSCHGLRALLEALNDGIFPEAFRGGMCRREELTGDTRQDIDAFTVRDSVRDEDDEAAHADQVADAVLIIGADRLRTAQDERDEFLTQAEAAEHGLHRIQVFHGATLGLGREHFGFRDGLSQPEPPDLLDGWESDGEQVVAPGEFIRGCTPEPESANETDVPPWERYGSYLVFRRLEQNVRLFRKEMEALGEKFLGGLTPPEKPRSWPRNGDSDLQAEFSPRARLMAARLMGRWPSGATLTEVFTGDSVPNDPGAQRELVGSDLQLTAGGFAGDPAGRACPLFAHIRKANPRHEGAEGGLQLNGALRRHRIIRRGIPYDDTLYRDGKGLLFLSYQSRIEDGFEHIQDKWLNDRTFGSPDLLGPGPDPIAGGDGDGSQVKVHMPVLAQAGAPTPDPKEVLVRRLITAKGGGYFFAPSIRAIEILAGLVEDQ